MQVNCCSVSVVGAGGQNVHYLGYVEVSISFPQTITGKKEDLIALALVVPEHYLNSEIPLLIGTNVLDRLYHHGIGRIGPKSIFHVHSGVGSAQIFQHIDQAPIILYNISDITLPKQSVLAPDISRQMC